MQNMTAKQILDLEDDELEKAMFQPITSRLASRIFRFLRDNDNLTTNSGGMSGVITGLDRSKLAPLAKGYGLNLYKFMFAVDMFEKGILNVQKDFLSKEK